MQTQQPAAFHHECPQPLRFSAQPKMAADLAEVVAAFREQYRAKMLQLIPWNFAGPLDEAQVETGLRQRSKAGAEQSRIVVTVTNYGENSGHKN